MSYEHFLTEDARLVMLKAMAAEIDGALNETMLLRHLDAFGHRRARSWVREQIRALEAIGAVRAIEQGSVLVATITEAGQDHVDQRALLDGIAAPGRKA